MNYEIIATIGPATDGPAAWHALLEAGATRFRLNTSHIAPDEVERSIHRLRDALGEKTPPIVLDLQGSKWRLGPITPQVLTAGDRVELVTGGNAGGGGGADESSKPVLPVPHEDFFHAAENAQGLIRLNDARVELAIETVRDGVLACRVLRGGPISGRKGISLPGSTYRREGLLPRDRDVVRRTAGTPGVSYAVSYVRDGVEMASLDSALGGGGESIAKLERPEAITEVEAIAAECGEVWLCRGDLGAEAGSAEMARLVHEFHSVVPRLPVPSVIAGQVLEHMTAHPEPTRSELCNLYDLLHAGFVGLVLSDETAIGDYTVESVRTAALFRS